MQLAPDYWQWNGSDWSRLDVTQSSLPRLGIGTEWVTDDATRSLLMIAGGTWTWTQHGWTQLHPAHTPPAGTGVAAYDPSSKEVLLAVQPQPRFAMPDPMQQPVVPPPVQTWAWNGSDWQHLAPRNEPAVTNNVAVTDPGSSVLVTGSGRVWQWEGDDWVLEPVPAAPPYYQEEAATTDEAAGQIVLFGATPGPGYTGPAIADMTVWNGTTWARVRLHAAPTPTPAPPPRFSCMTNSPTGIGSAIQPDGDLKLSVSAIVELPPCHFQMSLTLTLADHAGHAIPVQGNPVSVLISQSVPESFTDGADLDGSWTWSNWCGGTLGGAEVLVNASGPSLNPTQVPLSPETLAGLPRCRDASGPSTIVETVPAGVEAIR